MNHKKGMRARRGTFNTEPVEVVRSTVGQAARQREEEERRTKIEADAKIARELEEQKARLLAQEKEDYDLGKVSIRAVDLGPMTTSADDGDDDTHTVDVRDVAQRRAADAMAQAGTTTQTVGINMHTGGIVAGSMAIRPDGVFTGRLSSATPPVDAQTQAVQDYLAEELGTGQWGTYRSTIQRPQGVTMYQVPLGLTPRTPATEDRLDPAVTYPMERFGDRDTAAQMRETVREIVRIAKASPGRVVGMQIVEGPGTLLRDQSIRDMTVSYVYRQPIRHVIISGFGTPNALVTAAARAHTESLQSIARETLMREYQNPVIVDLFPLGRHGEERYLAELKYGGSETVNRVVLLNKAARGFLMSRVVSSSAEIRQAIGEAIQRIGSLADSD